MSTDTLIIVSIAVTAALLLVYSLLYITEKKLHILLWMTGWFMFLLSYTSRYVLNTYGNYMLLVLLNIVMSVFSYFLIFWGTCLFFEFKNAGYWLKAFIIIPILVTAGLVTAAPAYTYAVPSSVFISITLARLGILSFQERYITGKFKYILGGSFFFWSLIILAYPFFKITNTWPLQTGYLAAGIVGLLAAMCLLALNFQKIHMDITSRERKMETLDPYDMTSGLYNRNYIEEQAAKLDTPDNLPISFILIELNHMKLIQDIFGQQKGRQLVENAVNAIEMACRKQDIISRWSEEKLAILSVKTDAGAAESLVGKIRENWIHQKSAGISLHVSLGTATKTEAGQSFHNIFKETDERLYANILLDAAESRNSVMKFLDDVLRKKDDETEEHIIRLKNLAGKMGTYLNLSNREIEELSMVAALHDIGKIAIPDHILTKTGPLTEDEWAAMKRHTILGCRIAQASRELAHISGSILSHHERWNGSGYPHGLAGDEIPLYSRIISIVDSFDVMIHDRPYKKAMPIPDAIEEIKRCSGSQFDPELVKLFLHMIYESI